MTTAVLEDERTILPPEDRDEPDGPDPDAPYGRNPTTGKPYKRPAATREKLAAALSDARAARGAQKAPQRTRRPNRASGTRTAGKPPTVDYAAAAAGILGIGQMGLGIVGRITNRPALQLDAMALGLHTPALAEAAAETALESEWLASVLEKAMVVGPYGKWVAIGLGLTAQIAANHGMVPAQPELGILDAEGLVAAFTAANDPVK